MKTYINYEAFEFIERQGSTTPTVLAKHFGTKVDSAASWLSKWATRGYLEWVPGPYEKKRGRPGGCYKIGKKWWGDIAFDVNKDQG